MLIEKISSISKIESRLMKDSFKKDLNSLELNDECILRILNSL